MEYYMRHLLLLTVLFLVGCGGAQAMPQKSKEVVTVPVKATEVIADRIVDTYRTTAIVEARNSADVKARSTGIVTDILVEEGDIVQEGQLLAQLDVERLALQERKDLATLNKLKSDYNRQKLLFEKELVSANILENAKFNYESQLAQYNISKLNLERASVRSPISGVVATRNIKLGNMAQDGSHLFTVVDMGSLSVDLHLPEKELAVIRKGQDVLLSSDLTHIEHGKIDIVSPIVDSQTGTFRVRVNIGEAQFRPGQFLRVAVVTNTYNNAIIVDKNAIVSEDDEAFVFVVSDNIAVKRMVTTGVNQDRNVQVLSGLEPGEQVVSVGQRQLKDGTPIVTI